MIFFVAALSMLILKEGGPATSKAMPLSPALGVRLVGDPRAYDGLNGGIFIYEAALSGRFGPVESVDPSSMETVVWHRIDNREACTKAADDEATSLRPRFLQPFGSEQNLLKGVCVIGEPTQVGKARWVLRQGFSGVEDAQTGALLAEGARQTKPGIWNAFGHSRFNATNWNDEGSARRPDTASDADLIAALDSGSPSLGQAAVIVLSQRLETSRSGAPIAVTEVQPTGVEVGLALARSGRLRDSEPWRRAQALMAAAAIPAAADKLLPEIVAALDAPAEKPEGPQTVALRQRLAQSLGDRDLLGPSGPKADDRQIANAAALAASRYGPVASNAVAKRLDSQIRLGLRQSDSRDVIGGLVLLASQSRAGETIARDLIEQDGPPLAKWNGCRIIRAMKDPNSALRALSARNCTDRQVLN